MVRKGYCAGVIAGYDAYNKDVLEKLLVMVANEPTRKSMRIGIMERAAGFWRGYCIGAITMINQLH